MRRRRWTKKFACLFGIILVLVSGIFVASRILEKIEVIKDSGFCKNNDTEAPVITLNGGSNISIEIGERYEELGASAIDDCDKVEINIAQNVDTNAIGTYIVKYSARDRSGNVSETTRTVDIIKEHTGIIYLTFDDGPSIYTTELLDLLQKYNVKATFFVTKNGDDATILREFKEGHAIGMHTFSHDYAYIYQDTDNFWNDLLTVQDRIRNITGETTLLMRFPGGSSNTISMRYDGGQKIMSQLTREAEERGFSYFDWNVDSGDTNHTVTSDEIFANVINSLKIGDASIVLQHDTKKYSVEAVEKIIQYGLDNGYKFDKLNAESYAAHHKINN